MCESIIWSDGMDIEFRGVFQKSHFGGTNKKLFILTS